MKLSILGIYGPFPAPGGGCSSYLVEDRNTRILLDCGSGALQKCRAIHPELPLRLDAVVLSHMHADHAGEIDLFRYQCEFGLMQSPLKVFSPETDKLQAPVFDPVRTYDGLQVTIGSMTLRFAAMQHAVPTMGVHITDAEGRTLFYTGDTGWFDGLVDAVKGVDLLLADACLRYESNEKALKNHMTVAQVLSLREQADCDGVILTHLFPDGKPYPQIIDRKAVYAREGMQFMSTRK
ncbi:MAG: MBL fold metallo-hydrolase [Clostridia bacterium]|nr:MBL fold metallo-hydrolase [Clostridia bacterium]